MVAALQEMREIAEAGAGAKAEAGHGQRDQCHKETLAAETIRKAHYTATTITTAAATTTTTTTQPLSLLNEIKLDSSVNQCPRESSAFICLIGALKARARVHLSSLCDVLILIRVLVLVLIRVPLTRVQFEERDRK